MAQFFQLHPENPQLRLLRQAAQIIQLGGLAAVPTDGCYSLVCALDNKSAVERLRRLKGISDKQHLALLCSDLSALGNYAVVSNAQYRLLKAVTPGPYTFILNATKEVPKRISHPSKKSIGLRVPAHAVVQGLLSQLDAPLIATTLQLPEMEFPFQEADKIREQLEHDLDLVLSNGSPCGVQATTVIDWTCAEPRVLRVGAGPLSGPLEPVAIEKEGFSE